MRSKGFTLIELLAVIVILAIIALIATPIILGIINDTKKGARERSIDNIIHAAEIYYAKEYIKDPKVSNKINIEDIKDEIKGEVPESGYIIINSNGDSIYKVEYKDKIYVKLSTGETVEEPKSSDKYYIKLATTTNGETELFLEGPIRKDQIEKVITVPTNKVPIDAVDFWDVTDTTNQEETGKAMAWYYDKDSNGLYEVYIGQEGRVKANPDSTKLFNYLINVTEIDLTYLDTSKVTDMKAMFQRCEKLEKIIGLENFDTSNVENMGYMFNYCYKLQSINTSNFNTSKTKCMSGMFKCCESLIKLDVSGFNTSETTLMDSMFYGCINITVLDVSNFNTSKVTTLKWMFSGDSKIGDMQLERIIGLDKFDTSNVTDMNAMFQRCSSLTSLDIRNFDTSQVTDMSYMFYGTTNLKPIYVGENWKTATTTDYMFGGTALTKSVSEMCEPNSTHSYCTLN